MYILFQLKNEVSIKFRINDNLEQYEQIGNSIYQKVISLYEVSSWALMFLHSKSHRASRYSYHFNKIYFLRISTLPLSLAKKVVLSELYLNFFNNRNQLINSMILKHLMNKKQGLLLFSGPTGSGKSTLMYQMVSYANKALNLNVISIEDPVEMQIPEYRAN